MYPVSARFLQALARGPQFRTTCTVTPYGADPITVDVKAGTLQVNGTQRIRRKVAGFQIVGDSTVYEQVTAPGAVFSVTHGPWFGSSGELIPIFTGEAISPKQRFGDGSIDLTLVDLSNWLSRCRFSTPYVAAAGTLRTTIITAVVQAARPGTTVTNLSSDVSTIPAQQMWTEGPLDVVADMARDGGTEAFFGPDGEFIIRDQPTLTSPPVWTAAAGAGGTLESVDRIRPLDRLFNKVIVRPAARDGSLTWADQSVSVTDLTHPRHYLKVGVVPDIIYSTAATAAAAMAIAQRRLDQVLGTTESLAFGAISNAALEASDVLRIATPTINNEPAKLFQHFLDSFELNLNTGSMTGATRSQVVTDA
jgi:hypothetical protein